jgi:N-acetylglucosaminyl-diphospho-decaprenol L-rhamnosyltransferase
MSAPVAVAVVSWNTRELLRGCLRSLEPEIGAGRAEVWVVDNCSSDGSRELVREEFPAVTLLEPERNLGFGPAVNLVAGRSDSEWIAPANADIALEPGALELLLEVGRADPRTGCVAPRLVLPDGSTQHSVYRFPGPLVALATHLPLPARLADRFCLLGGWDPERPREVDWPVGAFVLVRREAWEAAGGFDDGQWMFAEDLDLGWRLARAGWARRYEPRARVRHFESAATGEAFGGQRTARTMDATYAWLVRRRGRGTARVTASVGIAAMAAQLALLAPLARFAPGRFAARRDRARFWLGIHRRGARA